MRAFLLVAVLCAAASLSACASVDESLFGSAAPAAEPSTTPAPEGPSDDTDSQTAAGTAAAAAPANDQGAASPSEGAVPGTLPPTEPGETASATAGEAAAAAPPSATTATTPVVVAPGITGAPAVGIVTIQPGKDTGTGASHTIAGLRANLQDAAGRTVGAGQQYASLESSSAQQLAAYFQAQAQISARLQTGTTRANPELVAQWNGAQAALDQLTANVNALGTLISQIDGEIARVRDLGNQVQSTFEVPGSVEEDHRQLTVMEDEANQIVVVLERLARDAPADLRRQTVTLSNERARLAQLANGIKAGDLYASASSRGAVAAVSIPSVAPAGTSGAPIVTIHSGSYQKTLYSALSQALQGQPSASFNVVGVSPTRGSAAALQTAQNEARRRAQDVMRTMTQMGVPPARMDLSSATDPTIRANEVRVFLR